MCPSSNPGKGYCNSPNQYYCSYWGCETIAPSWIPGDGIDKYLKVQWGPYGCIPPQGWEGRGNCKYLFLNVTQPTDRGWIIRRTWGIRYWEPGTDKGGTIFIKKEKVEDPPQEVGPNRIISGPKIKTLPLPKSTPKGPKIEILPLPKPTLRRTSITEPGNYISSAIAPPTGGKQDPPLWKVMQATYDTLNRTNPE